MDPIATEDLIKRFGDVLAVDRLTLDVPAGQILGFLGPNGAGKSTTIHMLTGLVRPTAGRAWIMGHDVRTDPVPAREKLGYLPEVVGLYEEMTGRQFLRYTGRFFDLSASEVTRRTEELLDRVGLAHAASRRAGTYSKGMRQRLALAAALFHDPPVLVLDEPLTGLDPEGVLKMRRAIRRLGREKTIFLSSHELHAVETLCDRAVIIDEGRVLADAPLAELVGGGPPRVRVAVAAGAGGDADGGTLTDVPGVAEVVELDEASSAPHGPGGTAGRGLRHVRLVLDEGADPAEVLAALVAAGVPVAEFRREAETLEEVFVRVTGVIER